MKQNVTHWNAMAGKREIALRNLPKPPAGGRPKDTPEKKAQRMALLERMKQYMESGEAEADFEKLREKMVDKALTMAMDRTYGPVKQSVEHSGAVIVRLNNTAKEDVDPND